MLQFNVSASDQSNPERTGMTMVIVDVIRDDYPPNFVRTPYDTVVIETSPVGSSVFTVSAEDPDLRERIMYSAAGDFQAPYYFNVNASTGVVTVNNNIRDDVATSYAVSIKTWNDLLYWELHD